MKPVHVFENIHPSEQLFQTFYAAKQEAGESVANYGMRLESLLQTCIDRGEVSHGARNEMLRSKLWSGLSDTNLRNASRYKYDTIHDFETLRMELRTIELDLRTSASASPSVSATSSKDASNKKSHISQVSDNNSSMDAILRKLDAMNKRMTEIERKIEGSKGQSSTDQGAQGDSYYSGRGSGTHSRVLTVVDLVEISEVDLVEISEVDPIDSSGVDLEVSEAVLEAELEAVMVSVEVLEADPEVDSVDTPGADMVVFMSIISHRMII